LKGHGQEFLQALPRRLQTRPPGQRVQKPPAKELESQGPEALLARCKPGRNGIRPSQIDLLLQVQKSHGNRAVQRMLQRATPPLKAVLFSKPHSISSGHR
jgi:hypothetical protein